MAAPEGRSKATTILFDLRTIIGVLFTVYGIVCVIWGLAFQSAGDRQRTGNVNLNLWAGIGMLVLAAFFLIWSVSRPIIPDAAADGPDDDASGTGSGSGGSPTGAGTRAGERPGATRA